MAKLTMQYTTDMTPEGITAVANLWLYAILEAGRDPTDAERRQAVRQSVEIIKLAVATTTDARALECAAGLMPLAAKADLRTAKGFSFPPNYRPSN